MADKITREIRSRNMSQIQSKNTKPELIVRKYLFARGLRYRLHLRDLPGSPDLVFPKYKKAVFVNGCFWHRHNCRYATTPKTNTEFWLKKFAKNVERDDKNYTMLKDMGWDIIIVWECMLKKDSREDTLEQLFHQIVD